jgi:hypothetical protein
MCRAEATEYVLMTQASSSILPFILSFYNWRRNIRDDYPTEVSILQDFFPTANARIAEWCSRGKRSRSCRGGGASTGQHRTSHPPLSRSFARSNGPPPGRRSGERGRSSSPCLHHPRTASSASLIAVLSSPSAS